MAAATPYLEILEVAVKSRSQEVSQRESQQVAASRVAVKLVSSVSNDQLASTGGSSGGEEGETPDSGLREDKFPPPITSIAPAILRAGGGPAFLTATDPAYFEFSLTTAIGIDCAGAGIIWNCLSC